jgi:hypothetical protein
LACWWLLFGYLLCFWGLSGSFYRSDGILWGTIAAIDNNLEIGFPLNDVIKLEKISEGFAQSCQGRMKGCVMAMDGWVMKTRCPNAKEVTNQICFRNRKGVWGMVIFAAYFVRFFLIKPKYEELRISFESDSNYFLSGRKISYFEISYFSLFFRRKKMTLTSPDPLRGMSCSSLRYHRSQQRTIIY